MKLLNRLFCLLLIASLITACGDDDNEVAPEPSIEEASLAFDAQNPPVEVPSGLQQSNNQNAQQIASQLALVNGLSTGFSALFEAPDGATKSSNPINGRSSNGRTEATNNEVAVYTYSGTVTDPESGQSITTTLAYQITDLGTDFLFEFFFQINDGEFVKYLEGKESKGPLRNGYLEIFPSAYQGEEATEAAFTFEWNESASGLFEFSYFGLGSRVDIVVQPDNSGTIDVYYDDIPSFSATWNAAGTAGTYTHYDSEGNITETVDWNA